MYAKSRNTLPEFIFTAALTTVAALMGPKVYMRLRKEYPEPVNLFTICMAEPGAGKGQAFRMSIIDPIMSLGSPLSNILVDEYTCRGLFRHLQQCRPGSAQWARWAMAHPIIRIATGIKQSSMHY